MDQESANSFPLHSDEVIIWMEYSKGLYQKSYFTKLLLSLIFVSFVAIISAILAILFEGYYVILNLTALFSILGVFAISATYLRLWTYNNKLKKYMYYVTNYRVIEHRESKKSLLKYGYINNIAEISIITYSNENVSLEFEWNDSDNDFNYCYGFNNIDNAKEIYDIIIKQQNELKNTELTFDFIAQ